MNLRSLALVNALLFIFSTILRGEITTVVERNPNDKATLDFKFQRVPTPSKTDAATPARFTIVDGRQDSHGGDVNTLHDGKLPREDDQPSENFFFDAGTEGGRLVTDLGHIIEIKQINTYSWHSSTRAPQFYKLYASDGKTDGFNAAPKKGSDPEKCGWKLITVVDTRPKDNESGGQYSASISDSAAGMIGAYRYLLFDISPTENADSFGNTFYSEIDVIDRNAPKVTETESAPAAPVTEVISAEDGKYQFTIDTTLAPDLTEWARQQLAPVVQEWYPKIVKMLPSDQFEAPTRVTIGFKDGMGGTPAAAGGTRINCNIGWFRKNLPGEARGAVVHEMVHVVQQYGRARRNNPNATRLPGWLVEGIADYIRWFRYEPQTKGAEITERNIARARYDGNYRITANFLDWVTRQYDPEIARKLNAAARDGTYAESLWKDLTGKTVQELGDEWKKNVEEKITAQAAPKSGSN